MELLYISKEDIEKNIQMKDVIKAVKKAFSMTEKGKIETPLRTALKSEKGMMLFMPAYSAELGVAVLKNVNVFPGNAEKGLSTTPAEILLIDANTGYNLAILDGTYVTQLRTGAASGAAFDVLAKRHCRKGALIGTGGQAETQLEAMITARDLEQVSIFSLNEDVCAEFVEKANRKYASGGISFKHAESADKCVEDADLIITVTTSEKPVFDGRKVKKGATISCVGTYEPHKQEVDSVLIGRADKIVCDSKDAVLSESGDILIPIEQGVITQDDIYGNLGEIINGNISGRENDDEIILFKTVGIAAQDLVTSGMIFNTINNQVNSQNI